MTINDRIKYFRKNVLAINQTQFAESIGMKQRSASHLEQPGSTVTDQAIKTICLIYNLNEEWLRNGTEPMFIEPDSFSLDDFAHKNNATALEIEIIKIYFELDQGIRQQIVNHFRERLASFDDVPATPAELEKQFPPVTGDGSSEAG